MHASSFVRRFVHTVTLFSIPTHASFSCLFIPAANKLSVHPAVGSFYTQEPSPHGRRNTGTLTSLHHPSITTLANRMSFSTRTRSRSLFLVKGNESNPGVTDDGNEQNANTANIEKASVAKSTKSEKDSQKSHKIKTPKPIDTKRRKRSTKSANSKKKAASTPSSTPVKRPLPDFSAFAYEPNSTSVNSDQGSTQNDVAPEKEPASTIVAGKATKEDQKSVPSTPSPPPRRSRKKSTSGSRKREKIAPGSLAPPKNWEKIYSLVEELRADLSAPLDSDGGGALPQKDRGEVVYRYQVLIALMLSSQTKDAVVGETIRALQQHGLDVENIRNTPDELLNKMIFKVGFRNNKTKYIKQASDIIALEYNGDIPPTAKEMMKLPGVGPKMSYIVESIAFNRNTGIGVDTHMHRMFNLLKWVDSSSPERTREQLEGWLPKEKWGEVNALFVGFGQETQQQKEKILKKALACSRPDDALRLIKRVGVDLKKEGKKFGLENEINSILRHETIDKL